PTQAQSGWLIWAAQQILAWDPLTALATGDFAPWADTHPINLALQQRALTPAAEASSGPTEPFSATAVETYLGMPRPETPGGCG
ncbi:MAG: hypothetical protein V7739_20335, partial [Motiliproteus sp.]